MVVFWPLGIWMASQSRFNVNSVFSYIVSCLCHSERRRGISGCIWNERVLPRRWKQLSAYYAINRENDERLRHVEWEVRRNAVNDLANNELSTHPACSASRFSASRRTRSLDRHSCCPALGRSCARSHQRPWPCD